MAEIVLAGSVNIADNDGERHLLVLDGGNMYRITLSFQGAAELGEALQKSPEEMEVMAAQRKAISDLIVPGHVGENGGQPTV
jgi:hypothetical protein